jgi:hypothetical protein
MVRQTGAGRRTATAPLGPAQAAPRTPRAHTTAFAGVTMTVDSTAKPATNKDTIKKVRIPHSRSIVDLNLIFRSTDRS